jgi:electron transport complex protein RnfC
VLEDLGVPDRVVLTFGAAISPAPEPMVRLGSHVHAGQVVAEILGAHRRFVLSPVSGTVAEVRRLKPSGSVVAISADGSPVWQPVLPVIHDWRGQPRERLEDLLYAAGLGGLPTRLGSAPIGPDEVENVVVSAVADDIYNLDAAVVLDGRLGQLAESLDILRALYPRAAQHIAIDARGDRVERILRGALTGDSLRWHRLPARYPQHMDVLLHDAVADHPRAPGATAIASGTLALDLQDALAVRDAVAEGRPAISRIVALCGTGFARTPHVRVRVGTRVAEVVRRFLRPDGAYRVVENSLLRGGTLAPAERSIELSTSALIAVPERERSGFLSFARPGLRSDSYSRTFAARLLPLAKSSDTNLHGEPRACIACGFCEAVCPARIMPHLLHRYVQRDFIDETLVRFDIARCIECNLCTYVCTSKIDVASLLRAGKEKLVAEGLLGRPRAVVTP